MSRTRRIRHQTLKLITAGVISIVGPVLFLLVPLSLISRCIVRLIAYIFRPDLECFFKGKGLLFALDPVYVQPKVNTGIHIVLSGTISVEKAREIFQERILNLRNKNGKLTYPQLQQSWTQFGGFLFWKWEREFDLCHHIRGYDYEDENLALPSSGVCTEADLKRIRPHLTAQPYAEGTSPWEFLIVPNYRSEKNTTGEPEWLLILRIHHALLDGFSLIKFMIHLFEIKNPTAKTPKLPKMSLSEQMLMEIWTFLRISHDTASQLLNNFGGNSWALVDKKLDATYYEFWSDHIPVEKIKEIKNKYHVSYNSTLYAITIGAIRRSMIGAGQEVPKELSFCIPFPLPLHPFEGLVVHTGLFLSCCSPRVRNPEELLLEISNKMKKWQVALATSLVIDFLLILPVFAFKLVHDKLATAIIMSTIAGSEQVEELEFDGKRKPVDWLPFVGAIPGRNIAIAACLFSLTGTQRFLVRMNKALFHTDPAPADFARHVNDEVDALLNT